MIIRKQTLLAGLSGLAVLVLAGTAPAATTLRTDPGGALLSGPTTLTNTSSDPLQVTGFGGVGGFNCSQSSFDADVSRNSSATSITGTLTSLTFTSCAGGLGGTALRSCALSADDPSPIIHFDGRSNGGLVVVDDPTLQCATSSPTAFCYYTAPPAMVGMQLNAPSTLSYPSPVGFVTASGTGSLGAACGTGGFFTWTFTHIVQGFTSRTITITTT